MKPILEICCTHLEACIQAEQHGADRIELCGSMASGGLTPSFGLFQLVKKQCSIPVAVMLRPRGSGFCYEDEDILTMQKDAEIFLEHGADGIVFGCLHQEKTIDRKHTAYFCDLAHAYGKEAVFHKAIDDTKNIMDAIEVLCELGVDRVLTSGGLGYAKENTEVLKRIVSVYGSRIQVLIGGGIRADNVAELMAATGAKQVHSACRIMKQDRSIAPSTIRTYDNAYDSVSGEEVYKMAKIMKYHKEACV